MLRCSLTIAGLIIALFGSGATLWGQESVEPSVWPEIVIHPDTFRGSGFYLSTPKLMACWLVFLFWVRTADWVSTDAQFLRLNFNLWNPLVVGIFSLAYLLVWFIPMFPIGIALLFLAYVVPFAAYVFTYRNRRVEEHQRVFTPQHLRFWFAEKLAVIGIKIAVEKPSPEELGPPVHLMARDGLPSKEQQAFLIKARQLSGYNPARELFADAAGYQAEAILMDFGSHVSVRYLIDGVWHNHQPKDLETGTQVLAVLKTLCGIDPNAQAAQQAGQFVVEADREKMACQLSCQAQAGAQRLLAKIHRKAEKFANLEQLGMRPKLIEMLVEQMSQPKGMVIFSALPGGGLTTTIDVALTGVDRFMRDFVSIEDEASPESEVVNVDVKTYKSTKGQRPATILPSIARARPDVIVCRKLVDAESATMLCEQVDDERLVITSLPAKDAPEALLRVAAMKVPIGLLASTVSAVLHVRLVRKLCDQCKEAYAPSEQLLGQLGLPVGKVQALYRAPNQPDRPICPSCNGLGYRGRTGLFQLMIINDTVREVLTTKPQLDLLRKAARQKGIPSHQEQGILLVARGITSLEELQRILKG